IATSVQGQPIEAVQYGTGSHSIVIVGAIHGNENNSAVLTSELEAHLAANLHLLPPDTQVFFLPNLNPDGSAINVRYNANGVDLNRNWDTPNWQPDTRDASGNVSGGGGTAPFSEPETAGLAAWLLALRDQSSQTTVLFYHSAYPPNGLVLGGSVGAPTAPAFADVIGYDIPAPGRGGWSAYPVTGAAPGWCRAQEIGCFEIELPSRANLTPDQVQRHAAAVLGVLLWGQTARGQHCFLETGFCISGRIKQFWEQNGGLAVFGFPMTRQQPQLVDGVERQVQWFERNRLELHPENEPPYDVLLGRLGVEVLESQGATGGHLPAPARPTTIAAPLQKPDTRSVVLSGRRGERQGWNWMDALASTTPRVWHCSGCR
ncbi:MAG: murein peptide amidase A, partial [Chloroflexaceae bacterium]|nr:murein peptide amidase A [Chloroflexaceae bacterium]